MSTNNAAFRPAGRMMAGAAVVALAAGSGCASKTEGTFLGAATGAVAGAAIGYAAGGKDGALIGAAAGAVVGGVAGYALSGKKETVKKSETQVREELTSENAPAAKQNVVEVQNILVSPPTVAAGQAANLQIAMRAVGNGTSTMYPPSADVAIYKGDQLLHNEELKADNTGDVDVSVDLPIPDAAEPGTYKVVVTAKPDPRVSNVTPLRSSRESTFEVVTSAAKLRGADTGRALASVRTP